MSRKHRGRSHFAEIARRPLWVRRTLFGKTQRTVSNFGDFVVLGGQTIPRTLITDCLVLRVDYVVSRFFPVGRTRTVRCRDGFDIQLEVVEAGKLLILRYQHADKPVEMRIPITTTPCRFGGERPWFLCPVEVAGAACGRRVKRLYLDRGLFGCRKCHNLAYASQNATRPKQV